ncbi:glutathione S-transferase family protein [Sneathiella sp. HT1-7]|uniref:glutathione S-transferase family protein n=1 Tax=Sneathiella sp. HT1-7 TaxID=2887192 RepID=UPI001D15E054|nr:glutathione S-transferase family protein [Sneathiella sp. HT1-7]MCC3305392.1 glutathione S-transferase family protein [Sneathiella sp. HT1-7]
MLKLYYNPGTIALAPHIALEESGTDYEAKKLNAAIMEHTKPEYLAINPKGRVPALVTDRGILTETPAILLYTAQVCGASAFPPPEDPYDLAQLQSFNNYLCSTVHVNHAHRKRGRRWVDEQNTAAIEAIASKVKSNMEECFHLIEDEMFEGPWVMGENYSIADIYLFTITQWMEGDGVDPADFPKLLAHRKAMLARPAVARVIAEHAAK